MKFKKRACFGCPGFSPDAKIAASTYDLSSHVTVPDSRFCICILVHGTWGRKAPFAAEESSFARQMRSQLSIPISFDRFEWSGRNTQHARIVAARELSHRITELNRAHRGVPIFLVGHSHGGNVARLAAQLAGIGNVVCGVICMSTPFLSAEARRITGMGAGGTTRARLPWYHMPLHLVLSGLTGTLALLVIAPLAVGLLELGTGPMIGAVAIPTLLILVVGYMDYRLGLGRARPRNSILEFNEWLRAAQESILATFAVDDRVNRITYVVTVTGDEALWWLRSLTSLSGFASIAWRVIELAYLASFFLLMCAVTLACVGGVVESILDGFSLSILQPLGELLDQQREVALVFGLVMLGSLFLGPVLLLTGVIVLLATQAVLRSHQLAFGEGVLANVLARIHVSRVPPGPPLRDHYHHGLPFRCLFRHSRVYSEAGVVLAITRWLQKDVCLIHPQGHTH